MNIILLSGGSGKRLWPLSNEVRSKQFLKIFKKADGTHESMVQRMYRMICEVDPDATVTIATSENQVTAIDAQLGDRVGISIEPCRRDTFPAIALATAYLHDVKGVPEEEAVVVCPVDPYVESDYFHMLSKVHARAEKGESNLVLMGIEPTYPSEKYGYIIPESKEEISTVSTFKEKPDAAKAQEYIEQGALWNAGVFAFKLKYVLAIAEKVFGTANYQELFSNYENLTKISFDYAVVEKESHIQVLRFSGEWKDLGTWNTLTEAMSEEVAGNAVAAHCENTHIINELQIPLVALGVNNLAIAATPDGILVADKAKSDQLKDYVSDQRPMYEKRVWGEYVVLDYSFQGDGNNSLTKHLIITPGQHISYQRHAHRSEIWTCVGGTGKIIIDGKVSLIARGDSAYIKPGTKHAIKADTELHIIEVQVGDELTEEDIERLDWDWENNGL
ncbi:MAG: cupin domain-containing protein [Ruminococcus sp.]|uniref:sugar phosphate nucleotidyltransferase n=1 Tax=Ruminococcus sp. TaxID=41978 RepID=UPI00287396BD|nr:sugar phosphate nucleotidyltransferase [Ruminococcus sp.]MBQ3285204.1 cupin domain-containing protein [Ruminococcus sp.]